MVIEFTNLAVFDGVKHPFGFLIFEQHEDNDYVAAADSDMHKHFEQYLP